MVRRALIGLLIFCSLSLLVAALESPVLIQPLAASYSQEQLLALEEAIDQLAGELNCTDLGSKKYLGSGGWTSVKFAAYTAGNLERLGYQVVIVSRQAAEGGSKAWVVVQVDLGGTTAWIPAEPLPFEGINQLDLGAVPLTAPLVYDSDYLLYDTIIELPANIPPTASIRAPREIVETEQSSWFGNWSVDPDGEIVLYRWTFGEAEQRATHTVSEWHTFDVGGIEYPVSLTVTDSRGAQATTSMTVYVETL